MKVQIISSSIRDGRASHSVALFLQNWVQKNTESEVHIIDLKERNFPLFHERLSFQEEKHAGAQQFSEEIKEADAVIIVAPEYNGSFPASLKNVIDVLYAEWQKKPVVLAPISVGDMAGAQVAMQLSFVLYKIGAYVTKSRFHVANVSKNFNEDGTCNNPDFFNRNAQSVWNELQEYIN